MLTNYSMLPPEVNSARVLAGAGMGPMLAAAAGWDELAAELHSVAHSFASMVSAVADGPWRGTASTAVAVAAVAYIEWLRTSAAQAGEAASLARTAAGEFGAAFAATVHPAVVAANRARVVSLVASNLLGHNAPAIAAAEAQYDRIWAQNVAAMAHYHAGVSAVAAQLSGIPSPAPDCAQTAESCRSIRTPRINCAAKSRLSEPRGLRSRDHDKATAGETCARLPAED